MNARLRQVPARPVITARSATRRATGSGSTRAPRGTSGPR